MSRAYTLAEAQANLPHVVAEAAGGETVQLVQDGKVIALLVAPGPAAADEERPSLAAYIHEFRATHDLVGLDTDSVFADVRDRSPGREIAL